MVVEKVCEKKGASDAKGKEDQLMMRVIRSKGWSTKGLGVRL